MKKIIAFDFDGVLCDSTEECLITGYNAWMKYTEKGDTLLTRAEDIPMNLARYFRTRRGLVKTGGQYFVVFNSYENHRIENEEDFDAACARYKKEIKEYEELFFESRKALKEQGLSYWLNLHTAYEGIPQNLTRIAEKEKVFIITGKDRDSVKTFLKSMNIDIPDSRIYDKNSADDKLEVLKVIAKVEKKGLSDIIFLDDNINHLLGPKEAGCKVYMADWGYHSGGHLQKARDHGIGIVGLKDWHKVISL